MIVSFQEGKRAAEILHLRIQPAEQSLLAGMMSLDGVVDGVQVRVEHFDAPFWYRAMLQTRADLGLLIKPASFTSKLGELFGRSDLRTGDDAFDKAFVVHADEPERVKALLTPALVAALWAWQNAGVSFQISDDVVTFIDVPLMGATTAESIVANARALAAFTRVLEAALASVPPSPMLAPHVEAWRAYAAAHGLSFSASPLAMWGKLGASSVTAQVARTPKGGHDIVASVQFERALPYALYIQPHHTFELLDGARSTDTGDAVFDQELRVTTAVPAFATTLLDPELRALLLELQRSSGGVTLYNTSISVTLRGLEDPSRIAGIVDRLSAAADHIRARLPAAPL